MFNPQIKTSDKKSGAVSSWFSSLRRTPKYNKKILSEKKLQKSCIDLSDTSKFYTSLDDQADLATSKPLIPDPHLIKAASVPLETPSSGSSTESSIASFPEKSSFCANCCKFTTISKQNETNLINTKDENRELINTKPNGDKLYYYTKKQNIKKVTTTTITRTTVINKQNRIGFIYASTDEHQPHLDIKRLLCLESAANCDATALLKKPSLNRLHSCICDTAKSSTQSLTALPSSEPLTKVNTCNVDSPANYYSCIDNKQSSIRNGSLLMNNNRQKCRDQNLLVTSNNSSSCSNVNKSNLILTNGGTKTNPLDDSTLEYIDSGNGSEIFGDRECTHLSCKHCKCKNKFKSAPELSFENNNEVHIQIYYI